MTRSAAREQCQRLKCLQYFPSEPAAIKELVGVLEETCSDTDHAKEVVASLIETMTMCPTPAEIRRVARERQRQQVTARERCPMCNGTGFILGWYLVTPRPGKGSRWEIVNEEQVAALRAKGVGYEIGKQSLVEAVRSCSCRGGKANRGKI